MKKSQVAIQLYTLRDHLKTAGEVVDSLKKVRDIGYQTVELAGIGKVHDDELVRMLADAGLTACAVHESGDLILNQPGRTAERIAKFGCSYCVYPWPGGIDFSDAAAVRKLAAGLDAAGKTMHEAGITLCYHNHHMEFRRIGARTILEELFATTKAAHLQAELDTHWVQVGGGNPVDWCRRMVNRLPLLHMKDYAINAENKSAFAEIGSGNLDWKGIVAAADAAGCKWFIVEQDTCPGDPFESIATSFEFVMDHLAAG